MIKTEQVNVNDPNLIALARVLLNAIRGRDLKDVKRGTDWFRWRDGLTYGAVVKVLESIHASRQDIEDYNQLLYDIDSGDD